MACLHSDGISDERHRDCDEFRKAMLSWFATCSRVCERLLVSLRGSMASQAFWSQTTVQALLLDEAGMRNDILSAHSRSDHICEAKWAQAQLCLKAPQCASASQLSPLSTGRFWLAGFTTTCTTWRLGSCGSRRTST